ncbi:hypothetical protein Tco_1219681 [Tanacetum coccineum]
MQQSTPTPSPITEATNPLSILPNFASVFQFNNRVTTLEKEVVELKRNDPLNTQVTALVDEHLDSRIGAKRDEFMSYLSASITVRITEQLKNQMPQILPKEVSNFAPLVIQSTVTESLEHAVLAKESSQPKYTYEAASSLIEFELKKILIDKMDEKEPEFEIADSDMPQDQEENQSKDDKEPKGTVASKRDWFTKPKRPQEPTDPDSNEGKTPQQGPTQSRLMTLASSADKQSKTFDELINSPIDFSAYIMKGLKITNLTQETLLGPTFKLLKGTRSNYAKLEYDFEELTRVEVIRKYGYGYLREIELQRADNDLYTFKEGDFPRLHINDMRDMFLLIVQNRLTNLSRNDVSDFAIALRMFTRSMVIQKRVEDLQLGVESYQKKINVTKLETTKPDIRKRDLYTPYQGPQGIIYVDNKGRNRLMQSDELCKFSDRTLTGLRTSLDDITKNIRMEYLPQRRWSTLEKKRSNIVIKAIDKQLKERRLMRSLKNFVVITEYLVNISKRHAFWSLNKDILKIIVLTTSTPLDENTNLIKELQASTDFALRNQKASIKDLEIQVRQMSIILHEKLSWDLRSSTEIMPRVNDEMISTSVKIEKLSMHRIDASQYAETNGEKDLEAHYTNAKPLGKALPQKEKDLRRPREKKLTNVGGVFTNLEILKCWNLENSRRLFNTNSCLINLHGESLPSKYHGSFSF